MVICIGTQTGWVDLASLLLFAGAVFAAGWSGDSNPNAPSQVAQAVARIQCGEIVASGFVAEYEGGRYFVTNVHVLREASERKIRLAGGSVIALADSCRLSRTRDVALVPIDHDGYALTLASPSADESTSDESTAPREVHLYVTRDGIPVRVEGTIRSRQPDLLEVTTAFRPGDSGSPIVDVASGVVVALASFFSQEPGEAPRYYGWRADGLDLQDMTIDELIVETRQFDEFTRTTSMLDRIVEATVAKRATIEGPDEGEIKRAIDWLKERSLWSDDSLATNTPEGLRVLLDEVRKAYESGKRLIDDDVRVDSYRPYYEFYLDARRRQVETMERLVGR